MSAFPVDLAPVKLAVRRAVQRLGGVDGCAAAVSRSRSTVGNWMNLNQPEFPPTDCVFAIDQCLIAVGEPPMIAAALARALGYSLIGGDDAPPAPVDLLTAQMALMNEGVDVQRAIIAAMRCAILTRAEINEIRMQAADLIDVAQKLSADLAAITPISGDRA